MKKDALAKHHFWILIGVAPFLTLLAFLLMWIFVSGEVSAQKAEYEAKNKALTMDIKTKGQVIAKEQTKDVLTKQKDELWSANFTRQDAAKVFDWPTGGNNVLQTHSDKKYKFGDNFRVVGTELSPLTLEAAFSRGYEKLTDQIEPTRFAGGSWRSALRYVSNWGKMPLEPKVVWLALEDYWAQKALLQPIADLNDAAARFTDITPKTANAPLKRTFQNRVWEVELEVIEKGNKKLMQGVLKNRTDRLQVVGMNKSMRLNVWLDDPKNSQADVAFLIQGENVPGKGRLVCEPRELGVAQVTTIARVEQVFDAATAPVRLVNTIELGMLDHKNRAAALETPKHLEEEGGAEAPAPNTLGPGETGEGSGRPGGPMGMMGASAGSGKSGTTATVLLGNKRRYIKRTEDVRRMPVALSLVIDRDFVNDLLIMYSNSVLRFQVTQTQWQRYRDSLPPLSGGSPAGVSGPSGGGPSAGGPGGSSDGGEGGRGYGARGRMPGGPPSGMMPGGPPSGVSPGGPAGTTGTLSASDEDTVPPEANAGLVELAVYGVISLYEKKVAPKPGEGQPPAEQPAAPMGEKPTGEQPMGEKPMTPAGEKPMGEKPVVPAPEKPMGEKAPPVGEKPPMTPTGSPTQPSK